MNQIKYSLLFIFFVILFTSCHSPVTIQRKMYGMRAELFYELTTPVYSENIENTVYLDSIDYSAMLPYSVVKKKSVVPVPLIIFNLVTEKFEVSLGNGSLIQPYHEFLTDALLAQCNRSSCFNLKEKEDAVLPDSAMILEIKVNKNETNIKLASKDGAFINPFIEELLQGFSFWNVNDPVCRLEITARLLQQGNCLWEKTYALTQTLSCHHYIEDPDRAYETCINDMTECLSYTTKSIVENISQNLHLLMLYKQAQ